MLSGNIYFKLYFGHKAERQRSHVKDIDAGSWRFNGEENFNLNFTIAYINYIYSKLLHVT